MQQVSSASYRFENTERIDGQLLTGEQYINYTQLPFRVFMEFIQPHEGATILYEHGKHNNKLLYDPVGFPYTNLYLDPFGSLARDKNHHTIFNVGFVSMARLLDKLYLSFPDAFTVKKDDSGNYQITLIINNYHEKTITLSEPTTTAGFSEQYIVSEYALVENNPSIGNYGPIKAGTTIKYPSSYAQSMIMTIDKSTYLPVRQEFFDKLGLFERYSVKDLEINKTEIVDFFNSPKKKKKLTD